MESSASVEDGIISRVIGISISKEGHDSNKSTTTPCKQNMGDSKQDPLITVHINDTDDLNDERIQPQQLRKLLLARPDLRRLLHECIVEEGLDQLEDEDDNVTDALV
jgi:hypothetical protein